MKKKYWPFPIIGKTDFENENLSDDILSEEDFNDSIEWTIEEEEEFRRLSRIDNDDY